MIQPGEQTTNSSAPTGVPAFLRQVRKRLPWGIALVGCGGAVLAASLWSSEARSAAAQDWPPFVLVSGLLLVGLVADEDGLFAFAGHTLARVASNGVALYVGATLTVATVTTLLNLDTSVAFLTPVLVYTARSRGEGEAPLLYGCILLSNAGSLLLPGSNLTNLIVLGHLHLSGGEFFRQMAPAGVAAILVTAAVVGIANHRALRTTVKVTARGERPVAGAGLVGVIAATVFVLVLRSPALPVAAVGLIVALLNGRAHKGQARRALDTLSLPVLVGLFGIAVTLGTVGRVWSGPAQLLSHLSSWATAGVAALLSVLVNNLPAASLLASRVPPRPFSLLVGLNIGPNLFITGSLAWVLWWRAARGAQAEPSVRQATRLGLISAPLSMAAAVALLAAGGLH